MDDWNQETMSRRKRSVSGGIKCETMPIGNLKEIGIRHIRRAKQVHVDAEQLLQVLLEAEKPVRQGVHIGRVELVKEIDIASRRIELSAGRGAEKLKPRDAIAPAKSGDFLMMLLDEADHFSGELYHVPIGAIELPASGNKLPSLIHGNSPRSRPDCV